MWGKEFPTSSIFSQISKVISESYNLILMGVIIFLTNCSHCSQLQPGKHVRVSLPWKCKTHSYQGTPPEWWASSLSPHSLHTYHLENQLRKWGHAIWDYINTQVRQGKTILTLHPCVAEPSSLGSTRAQCPSRRLSSVVQHWEQRPRACDSIATF
jgi:hypothetical protein